MSPMEPHYRDPNTETWPRGLSSSTGHRAKRVWDLEPNVCWSVSRETQRRSWLPASEKLDGRQRWMTHEKAPNWL